METERPKGDVLAIAEAGSVGRFFDQWGMPVRITARGQTRLRGPAPGAWVEDLSLAYVLRVERLRAQEMLTSIAPELPGILMGVPSPWQEGRVLMLATSPRGGEIPDVVSVQGPARSMHPGGDLFVVLNGTRATFQILPSRPSGEVPLYTKLRWYLSVYWPVQLPLVLLGVLVSGTLTRRALKRRAERRLGPGDGKEK